MDPRDSISSDNTISTADDFQRWIDDIVEAAVENGVDVEGSWPVVNGSDRSWDIEIVSLAPSDG